MVTVLTSGVDLMLSIIAFALPGIVTRVPCRCDNHQQDSESDFLKYRSRTWLPTQVQQGIEESGMTLQRCEDREWRDFKVGGKFYVRALLIIAIPLYLVVWMLNCIEY